MRTAVDVADRSRWGCEWAGWPRGCCSAASEMLSTLLLEDHGIETLRETGSDPCWELGSHAWLRCGRHVIDITGDQFPGLELPSVFVGSGRLHYTTWMDDRSCEPMSKLLRNEPRDGVFSWRGVYPQLRAAIIGSNKPGVG